MSEKKNPKCRNGMPGCDCGDHRPESDAEKGIRAQVNKMVHAILREDREEIAAKLMQLAEAYSLDAEPVKEHLAKSKHKRLDKLKAEEVYMATKTLITMFTVLLAGKPMPNVSVHVATSVEEAIRILDEKDGDSTLGRELLRGIKPAGDERGH